MLDVSEVICKNLLRITTHDQPRCSLMVLRKKKYDRGKNEPYS